jgi:hypothetical protein
LAAALAHCEKQGSSHGDYGDDDKYNQELSLIHAPFRSNDGLLWDASASSVVVEKDSCNCGPQLVTSTLLAPLGHYTKPIPAGLQTPEVSCLYSAFSQS